MDFCNSLFDFDFSTENYINRIDKLLWSHDIEPIKRLPKPAPPVCELPEVIAETIIRLEKLAEAALDADRMGAYFRILDELDRFRAAECPEMPINDGFLM